MDLLVEKGDSRTYLSSYKVITTSFEESSPSVKRNNTQIQYRNGNVDFGGWHESKTIDYVGYYRADDIDEEETLREKIYALLSDPDGYYITQLKNDSDNSYERPGENTGDYFEKQVDRPSHKRFYVYASSLESELVGSYGGHVLYKISATFTTMKLPYGESVPRDLEVKPNVPYIGRNLVLGTSSQVVQASNWNMQVADIKYDKSLGDNLCASVMINNAAHADVLAKGNAYIILTTFDSSGNTLASASGNAINYNANGLSQCFISINDSTADIKAYIRTNNMNRNAFYSCLKIEKGTKATPHSPAPEDPGYNKWYLDTYYSTDNLVIPYAGTVPCSQLEQGFSIEFTAKEAGSRLVIDVNGTELTYNGQVYSGDVVKLSGYEYTKNDISIVKATNKAYFKLLPGISNKISSSIAGEIRILKFQNLYA